MRVLLTGGRGFLGRRLLHMLGDHDVLSLVRQRDDAEPRPGVRIVEADLACDGYWRQAVTEFAPEWCFHLAWDGLPDYSLGRCRANLDANVGLIQTLAKVGVRRMVVAGTCWEYGRAAGAQREDAAPVECGVFAATKHAIRIVLDATARESGFEYRWARLFFVYGPGQHSRSLIPHLRAAYAAGMPPALREPNAVQDFVHVYDVARGLLALAQCNAPSGIFNLGSGQPTSVNEIANRVADYYGQRRIVAPAGTGEGFWADLGRTHAATGWRPEIGLSDGIALTLRDMDQAA